MTPLHAHGSADAPEAVDPRSTRIDQLGERRPGSSGHRSPLVAGGFVDDSERVLVDCSQAGEGCGGPSLELAGPRERLHFEPGKTKLAIVTCGGLCPGINDVIRSIVLTACHAYDATSILGVRYGLEGFMPEAGHDLMELTPRAVADIHEFGGTILGTSRGPQPPDQIVDALARMNVSALFVIGGDGSMRAAKAIRGEIDRQELNMAVIGVPKTIDNDIHFITRSFGFDTAVEQAGEAISCAHVEARGAPMGIGVVKVMGREAGFIAAQATLASKEVNFVLIPEDDFDLEGPSGFLACLERRLKSREHAVIVVAEGAGQKILPCPPCGTEQLGVDASGNRRLGDFCGYMIGRMKEKLKAAGIEPTIKFIDPSYMIRSVPANANDRVYCGFLGQMAVHAAMSGRTGMVVARFRDRYVHIPLELVTARRKTLDVASNYWRSVLETTGQPRSMR